MMGRSRHLGDDRLHDCYLTERGGDRLDPRAAEHLADCAPCSDRYDELRQLLDTIRSEGATDADTVFTTWRLQQQHDAVLRRLDSAGRAARVISFPGHMASGAAHAAARVAPRWLAAASAAGLIVGVGVGGTLLPSRGLPARSPSSQVATKAAAPRIEPAAKRVTPPTPPGEAADDDWFLYELEVALQRPHTRELLSFDNLTPHAREIGNRVR